MLLCSILKDKISDIVDEEITGTFASIKEIIRMAKHTNISKRVKWLLYIAIGILSLLFITVAFVMATLSILFTVALNITAFIILIIPGQALITIRNRLERVAKEN